MGKATDEMVSLAGETKTAMDGPWACRPWAMDPWAIDAFRHMNVEQ